MRRKMVFLNNISIICFFLSSASIMGVPFLNMDNEFPKAAYFLAGLFWAGLISGLILQIAVWIWSKKNKQQNKKEEKKIRKERPFLIYFGVFFLLFLLILLFCRESITLMSIDLACMLFSIEMFFYMKRRYKI